jgi:hypothetical protein
MLGTYVFTSRLVASTDGTVDRVRACSIGGSRVATAVRNRSSEKLEVIAWNVAAADPAAVRLDTGFSAYKVGAIGIAPVPGGSASESYVVTAQHAQGGGMHVALWKIGAHSVGLVEDVRCEPGIFASDVAVAAIDSTRFVTAAIDSDGIFHLHGWTFAGSFGIGPIKQFAHHKGVAATQPAITAVGGRPVAAKRNANGQCEVVTYDVSSSAFTVLHSGHTSGMCSEVAIAPAPGSAGVVTAMIDDENSVNVHAWRIDAAGNVTGAGHRQGSEGRRVSILDLGVDESGQDVVAQDHVVAISVGQAGHIHAMAVDTGDDPLPLMIDQPIVTTSAIGASSARLPSTTQTNDFGTPSIVDELLVTYIDAASNRLRLLQLSAHRETESGL